MSPELKGYLFATLYVIIAVAVALVFYKLGLSKKYTRKIVHILVGFEWVILSHYMGPTIHFLIVCLVFTAVLALSYFLKLLPAMSSDGENDPGTVYYGIAMSVMSFTCLFVPEMMIPFGIGVFCTSVGDGFAGVAGQLIRKHNPRIYRNKSLVGTLVNFVTSFGVAAVFNLVFELGLSVWQCIFIGILSAGIELIGIMGLDNIFITVSVALLSYGFIYWDRITDFIIPILVTPFLIAVITEKRALTRWGTVAAIFLDIVVSIVFTNFGFVVLLSFFVLSLVVDKIKKKKKKDDTITKKEGTRDLIQVIANGFIPFVMAVMFAYTVNYAFLIAYVASLSEAFADTVASGLGVYSKKTYDLFKMRKCESGISGGMSVIGTFSSLVAAILLSFIPYLFGVYGNSLVPVIISSVAAFAGVIFDSFLGSIFQIKYRCSVCGKLTEREYHCDNPTAKESGFAFFDNDVVNLMSGLFTAFIAIAAYFIFL